MATSSFFFPSRYGHFLLKKFPKRPLLDSPQFFFPRQRAKFRKKKKNTGTRHVSGQKKLQQFVHINAKRVGFTRIGHALCLMGALFL
jgi:hypothetical protein